MRWVPTDHMLVDCMTKSMPPDIMLTYLRTMQYAFKYDDVIKNTKREIAKRRKEAKECGNNKQAVTAMQQVQDLELPSEEGEYDTLEKNHVNVVDHYPLYYAMFTLQTSPPTERIPTFTIRNFNTLKVQLGFRQAYRTLVTKYCVDHTVPLWKSLPESGDNNKLLCKFSILHESAR